VHIGLSVVGAIAAIVVLLLIPRSIAAHRLEERPVDAPVLSMTGGGFWMHTYWPVNATWPFVRLELFSWGIRLGPSSAILNWLLPTTELTWADIQSAKRLTFGVRFRRVGTWGWVSFSRFGGLDPELWRQLDVHGVPSGG
jgi:hypothetical protein